jgi:hypothetical protein
MKRHSFASHTPEESRHLSDLGHVIEGVILAFVGVLALLSAFNIAPWAATTWPSLILFAGFALLLLIYPRHPVSDWPAIWRDAQQRQHTIMAATICAAGAAELLKARYSALAYVWPLGLFVVGGLFLTHAQHGTGEAVRRAVWQHRLLGGTLVAAGLLHAAEIGMDSSLAGRLWPGLLLAAAAQLVFYREPAGAYEPDSSHGQHRS